MKNIVTTLIATQLCLGIVQSQSLDPQVINSGGSFESKVFSQHQFSIGEVMVKHLFASDGTSLTQGVLQPLAPVVSSFTEPTFSSEILMFPNPISTLLQLKTDFAEQLEYKVHSLEGVLLKQSMWSGEARVDFTTFPAGSYVIHHLADLRLVKSSLLIKK